MSKQPWLKFDAEAWLSDPHLRMCSPAAQGLLINLMAIAHGANPYGYLVNGTLAINDQNIGKILAWNRQTVGKAWAELVLHGRTVEAECGLWYIPRMVKDHAESAKHSANGAKGGNPLLLGVKPPLKAEKKESKSKKEKREDPPTVPTGTGKAKSFKQWTKEDFQESIIKANHDGIINKAECINFRDYWIEPSASGRMKFSLQKTWDTRLRIHNAIKMVYSKQRIETKQAANGSDYVVQTTQEDG